jgi:sterol desaturase/sphingolipid hydroxylase (fatty acid hydroxylase superfamily)
MQEVLTYFENIPTTVRTLFLVSGLSFFLIVEALSPLFRFDYHKGKHAAINITFTLITLVINLFGAALIVAAVDYTQRNKFGILHMIDLPVLLYVIIGLALMDLIGAWLIHFLEHKIKWMWRFHIIHHSDTNVDVTSGLRHQHLYQSDVLYEISTSTLSCAQESESTKLQLDPLRQVQ